MSKKLIAITLLALSFVLVNCKDKSGDDPEPTKTLNKSLITGKYWKAKTTPLDHYFGADGKYYLPDGVTEYGTWKWLNNSDSMEIVIPQLSSDVIWHAEYCTETELKMRAGSDKFGTVFYKE
jgi:hypothetical protein